MNACVHRHNAKNRMEQYVNGDMRMEYIHGGDIYRNPVEYDFSVNINPLGMPLKSIQAAHEGIVLSGRYPDYRGEKLCQEISRQRGVSEKSIILGNGAAELIYACVMQCTRGMDLHLHRPFRSMRRL